MMLTRPPGPRSTLKLNLLKAVADDCDGFSYRRVGHGYRALWLHAGVCHEQPPPVPGHVGRFAALLREFAHGRPGVGRRAGRFVRRLASCVEWGDFDHPVGPDFVVRVCYLAVWRLGRVEELDIMLDDRAALTQSGIAKAEYDSAWHEPLGE